MTGCGSVTPAATRPSRWSRRRSTSISKSPARRPTRRGELGRDAPAEVLERVRRRVPRREDRRPEPLEMPVDVARDRADVVGRDDAATAVVEAAQDEDDPEMRQLVVGQPDRRAAQGVEDVVERVGVDRRGEAVADRRRADGDPGGLRPRCRPAGGRTARGRAGPWSSGRTGIAVGLRGRATPGQPSSDAWGSQSNVSVSPASSTTRTSAAGRRGARRGASSCRRPASSAATTIGTRASSSSQTVAASSRRACRSGSARRSTAARAGSAGTPSGYGPATKAVKRQRGWAIESSVTGALDEAPHVEADDGDTWRAWLEANHQTVRGAWLVTWLRQHRSGRARRQDPQSKRRSASAGLTARVAVLDDERGKLYVRAAPAAEPPGPRPTRPASNG